MHMTSADRHDIIAEMISLSIAEGIGRNGSRVQQVLRTFRTHPSPVESLRVMESRNSLDRWALESGAQVRRIGTSWNPPFQCLKILYTREYKAFASLLDQ